MGFRSPVGAAPIAARREGKEKNSRIE